MDRCEHCSILSSYSYFNQKHLLPDEDIQKDL